MSASERNCQLSSDVVACWLREECGIPPQLSLEVAAALGRVHMIWTIKALRNAAESQPQCFSSAELELPQSMQKMIIHKLRRPISQLSVSEVKVILELMFPENSIYAKAAEDKLVNGHVWSRIRTAQQLKELGITSAVHASTLLSYITEEWSIYGVPASLLDLAVSVNERSQILHDQENSTKQVDERSTDLFNDLSESISGHKRAAESGELQQRSTQPRIEPVDFAVDYDPYVADDFSLTSPAEHEHCKQTESREGSQILRRCQRNTRTVSPEKRQLLTAAVLQHLEKIDSIDEKVVKQGLEGIIRTVKTQKNKRGDCNNIIKGLLANDVIGKLEVILHTHRDWSSTMITAALSLLNNIICRGLPEVYHELLQTSIPQVLLRELFSHPDETVRMNALWVVGNAGGFNYHQVFDTNSSSASAAKDEEPEGLGIKDCLLDMHVVDYLLKSFDKIGAYNTPLALQFAETMRLLSNESTIEQFQQLRPLLRAIRVLLMKSNDAKILTNCCAALMDLSDGVSEIVEAFVAQQIVMALAMHLSDRRHHIKNIVSDALAEISFAASDATELKLLRFPISWLARAIFDEEEHSKLRRNASIVLQNLADDGDPQLIARCFHEWKTLVQIDQLLFATVEEQLRAAYESWSKKSQQTQVIDCALCADVVARSMGQEEIPSLENLHDSELFREMAKFLLRAMTVADETLLAVAVGKDMLYPLLFRLLKMFPSDKELQLEALLAIENTHSKIEALIFEMYSSDPEDDINNFDASTYWCIIKKLSEHRPSASDDEEEKQETEISTDQEIAAAAERVLRSAKLLQLL